MSRGRGSRCKEGVRDVARLRTHQSCLQHEICKFASAGNEHAAIPWRNGVLVFRVYRKSTVRLKKRDGGGEKPSGVSESRQRHRLFAAFSRPISLSISFSLSSLRFLPFLSFHFIVSLFLSFSCFPLSLFQFSLSLPSPPSLFSFPFPPL